MQCYGAAQTNNRYSVQMLQNVKRMYFGILYPARYQSLNEQDLPFNKPQNIEYNLEQEGHDGPLLLT